MIRFIILDVDGTMTNGQLHFDTHGTESKSFNVKDGLGITTWLKIGGEAAIITGRESKIVQRRAQELGVVHLFQGVKNKKEVLKHFLEALLVDPSEVAVIGDDYNDIGMFQVAHRSFAPSDATKAVKERADVVLESRGGEGAVREMIDALVEENGWKDAFEKVWL